jgi:hypothetical protein
VETAIVCRWGDKFLPLKTTGFSVFGSNLFSSAKLSKNHTIYVFLPLKTPGWFVG